MFEHERRPAAATMAAVGAIDGLAVEGMGELDERAAHRLARRLTYFLARPVTPDDVRMLAAGGGGWEPLELKPNGSGLTVLQCIDQVAGALEKQFGAGLWALPVPAMARYTDLARTRAWREADGLNLAELWTYAVGRGASPRYPFACEFTVLEMGHDLYWLETITKENRPSRHIAQVMGWPADRSDEALRDPHALAALVHECMAVVMGLPFDLCQPATPLAEILGYSFQPTPYFGMEQRAGAAAASVEWLWRPEGRHKDKAMLQSCQECVQKGQGVLAWVDRWP